MKLKDDVWELIEKNADGIAVVDDSSVVAYANPAAEAIFGKRTQKWAGQSFGYPLTPRKTTEVELRQPTGETRYAEIRCSLIAWEKRQAHLVTIRDITELKRVDQLKSEIAERRRVEQMKDEFMNAVSHELRTPLTIIKVAVDSLKDGVTGKLTDIQEKFITTAQKNVDRLARLLNDLLDLARLESGEAKLRRSETDFNELATQMKDQFQVVAQSKGVIVDIEAQTNLPALSADSGMLGQVFSNLLTNALRYAGKRILIKMECVQCDFNLDDDTVKLGKTNFSGIQVSIIDDGPGIPAEKIPLLFNKFVQLDRPDGGAGYLGTGLGLSICKEIVRLHHGRIWVDNNADKGCAFKFLIPQHDAKTDFWLAVWTVLSDAQHAKSSACLIAITLEGRVTHGHDRMTLPNSLFDKYASDIRAKVLRRQDSIYVHDHAVVILATTNLTGGLAIRKRILDIFKERVIDTGGNQVALSIKAGTACFPQDAKDPEQLFAIAIARAASEDLR
ncbi:MAG: ATP-binding protein [Elusimicrobiota bacterium]